MSILSEARSSDSPYIETVARGRTMSAGSPIRPAECHWHMVIIRQNGDMRVLVVGPWTTAGITSYTEGAEILWIRFTLGTFMPHLPATRFLDTETILPGATARSFWLDGSARQRPDYGNVETFVARLVRDNALIRDPVVDAVLHDHPHELSPRTARHRFLRATGLTQGHVRQVERAQRAAALLEQGAAILDTVHEVGYFDQPHLTRALRRWIGHTPAQIVRSGKPG